MELSLKQIEDMKKRGLTDKQIGDIKNSGVSPQKLDILITHYEGVNSDLFKRTFGEGSIELKDPEEITGVNPVELQIGSGGIFGAGKERIEAVPYSRQDYIQCYLDNLASDIVLPTPAQASHIIRAMQGRLDDAGRIGKKEEKIAEVDRAREYLNEYLRYMPIWTVQGIGIAPKGSAYDGKPITGLIGSVNVRECLESLVTNRRLPDTPLVEPDYKNCVEVNKRLVGQSRGFIQGYEVIGQGKVVWSDREKELVKTFDIVFPITADDNNKGLGRADPHTYFPKQDAVAFRPLALVVVNDYTDGYSARLETALPYNRHGAWRVRKVS